MVGSLLRLPRKLREHGRWLLRDPAHFVENLDHKLRPHRREAKMTAVETMPPLCIRFDPVQEPHPHINILLPKLGSGHLTGGPNTALHIAAGLVNLGVPTRVLSVDESLPTDMEAVWAHLATLANVARSAKLSFQSTLAADNPAQLGRRDVFLATWWTTAARLPPILNEMARKQFIYLIQDFEPSFYPWSSAYAQALQTYDMDYRGLINERLLADYFVATGIGRFAKPDFIQSCEAFEPAVDTTRFYSAPPAGLSRQLVFYARPGAPRNLFAIGLQALREAVAARVFAGSDWRFLAMGDSSLGPTSLGEGHTLEPVPWLSYEAYAKLMRDSDILLCPMLSPHTSYPVLEMAACRGLAVTNTFSTKSHDRLAAISGRIIASAPSVEGFRGSLARAVQTGSDTTTAEQSLSLPSSWQAALAPAVRLAKAILDEPAMAG